MTTKHLLDPELLPLIEIMPAIELSTEQLPASRAAFEEMVIMGDPDAASATREEVWIPGYNGGPDVRCLLYKPKDHTSGAPALVHIHGGGYVLGKPEQSDDMNLRVAGSLGAVVLSVDHRLAPEHPIPAPLDDCYAGLAWVHSNADELGVDTSRVAIGGESAGGGLAAALGLMARDKGEYPICLQMLIYPMLDDRTGTDAASGDPLVGEFVWTRESNQFGWNAQLGDAPRAAPQVPARAETLEGLPPTWLMTAGLDLFRDENILYAQRLLAAGVPTELIVYPAACHGFQLMRDASVSKRFARDYFEALRRGLKVG